MNIVTPYIPREYLALRINYCKQQLAELPNVVRSERNIRGEKKTVLVSESHCYSLNSTSGRKLAEVIQRREELSCELLKLEGLWNSTFRGIPPADIARFYTEQGIPFKYEPEIWLSGMNRPIYSDFVILIRELDLCKFHEHFGLKNSADYSRKTSTTYNNYSGAGLLPELDVFYTFDVDDTPFDIRTLHTKLNSAIYDSLFSVDISL